MSMPRGAAMRASGAVRIAVRSIVLGFALGGCASMVGGTPPVHASGASLRLIGEQRIAWRQPFMDTVVGGLSGIDYDPASGNWIMESDDRSEESPARFYTARLNYNERQFVSVTLTGMHYFRQKNGSLYPGVQALAATGGEVPDIETIRYDPRDGSIWYGSEGDRKLGMQPFVRHATADGAYLSALDTPPMLRVWPASEYGVRNNQAFEGLSFSPDGAALWLGMEAPLYQDGPVASATAGAPSRITRIGRDGKALAQYVYMLDAIPHPATAGKLHDNGISEILAIDDSRLYVLERSGAQDADDVFRFHCRIYEMDVRGATDVLAVEALKDAAYVAARKRLVLDLDTLPLAHKDNLEGMAFGARLANGHDTLVLVSDDNFNRHQVTQLLVFEIQPGRPAEN
jgi:hypothetical protein